MATTQPNPGQRVKQVRFDAANLIVDLLDGRTISAPLAWYPRLCHATLAQRADWQLAGGGYGIHWPQIDEDLSVEGLLAGAPAPGQAGDYTTQRSDQVESSISTSLILSHPSSLIPYPPSISCKRSFDRLQLLA